MCASHAAVPAAIERRTGADTTEHRSKRRRRLWELEERFHCSVIGTCLTLDELRHTCRKAGISFHSPPSDHELHSAFVNLAGGSVHAIRLLQKQLDTKYRQSVRQFQQARDPGQLAVLWDEALASGEVAGAFWALVTHGAVSNELLDRVYGEIHMLSHLAGASTRVDMQELSDLRQRVDALASERTREVKALQRRLLEKEKEIQALRKRLEQALEAESALREAERKLARRVDGKGLDQRLQKMSVRLNHAENALQKAREIADDWERLAKRIEARNRDLEQSLGEIRGERDALETSLSTLLGGDCAGTCVSELGRCPNLDLCGRSILLVGGRANQSVHFRALVERSNGSFMHHDGGKEDSHCHLAAVLPRADAVLCPLDCISHSAMERVKRFCKRNRKRLVLLPRSSLSAFSRGLSEVAA